MTTKVDLKRRLHEFYSAGREPSLVDVPEGPFLMIDGHGDPNTSAEYADAVQAVYSVAYAAKFGVKRATGTDFVVMPLEGLWWVPDMATFTSADKSSWDWTMLVRQPEEVTAEVVDEARAKAATKHPSPALARVRLERFAEGPAAQVMHVGPYDAEAPTIQRLHAFIAAQGCVRSGKHHEVYLSDPRHAAPERMKTILRQPVATS